MLKYCKKKKNDYTTYVRIVNRKREQFKLWDPTPDMFNCIIFVQVLTANKDVEIRPIILTQLELDSKFSVKAEVWQK